MPRQREAVVWTVRNRYLHAGFVLMTLILGTLLLVARPARGQETGVRAGVSAEPGQFYFGAHLERGPVADRLWFRPNLEVGLGHDATLIAANFEFAYHFPSKRQPWQFYAGAGPALNVFTARQGRLGRGDDGTEVGGGFNIFLGAAHRQGLVAEFKVGALDSPGVKFGVGYAFR